MEEETEVCRMYEEDDRIEGKIHNTLRKQVEFWRESGASDFAVSVILNGCPSDAEESREVSREE